MSTYAITEDGPLSVYVYTDLRTDKPIGFRHHTPGQTTSVWLSVPDARAAIAALSQGVAELEAKYPELRACGCGATIGESGVLEDGKATCAACYLAANGSPMVDGEVDP